jgi:hypothetical protein
MTRWPRAIEEDSQMIACSWVWDLLAWWPPSISERSMMMRKMMMNNNIIMNNLIMKEGVMRTTMIK